MHKVLISYQVQKFLASSDSKSRRILRAHLEKLCQPYPGRGPGDKERLVVEGEDAYRLHIGRTFTAFYIIEEEAKTVQVVRILPIGAAHKKYGF